ncbi:GLPGLI family protein [Pedobacter sp. ASV12]|uniref:GLPGLI family protein n=1 Tax=Pedobacter sp. ASV12 TaxID=2795120 RepID=UPI0018ED31C7|nr:GLPGLI family protein [Pedobacter sp. ASV12]
MKIKHILTIVILALTSRTLYAQNARFVTQGVIEYEKKVNMLALITERIKKSKDDTWGQKILEDYKKNKPQFKILKSSLTFLNGKTLFTPVAEEVMENSWFDFEQAKQNNVLYTNTLNGTSTVQKKIFEETYLVKDSTRKINWKLTDEIRNIAGYDCRRANAVIMDSIYVVAFYTDEIPVSGGPESFTGLPGMILGLALPKEHITWFATSVSDQPVTEAQLKEPTKGKPTDNKKLSIILKDALKDWGDYALDILRAVSI